MSTGDPYVYCPKDTAPEGPYDTGPETSVCGTKDSVTAIWPAVKKWKLDIKNCNFVLSAYVYNATQRGTYYYQFDGSGTMDTASEPPCATGHDDRTFSCEGCVTANYKFIPCCEETICNEPVHFYRPRQAMDMLSFYVTMNDWVVDPIGETNKQIEPNIYWDVPNAWIGNYKSNTISADNVQPGFSFYSCFDLPLMLHTEYGCNNGYYDLDGYDCFGYSYHTGELRNQGKGYWQLNGETWIYTSDWYYENRHGTWKCGKCTYCKGTKGGCNDCTPCTPGGHNCNGNEICTCSSCGDYDCGSGERASGYCDPQSCDDHDLWQKGHVSLTITPGSNDPTRCVS